MDWASHDEIESYIKELITLQKIKNQAADQQKLLGFKIQQKFKQRMYINEEKPYFQCPCGSIIRRKGRREHLLTQGHLERLKYL